MGSPYRGRMHPIRTARRHVEWFLTTDFDPRDPIPPDTVRAIIVLIILIITIGVLAHA